jgi:circadian clock protein KaiC
MSDGRRIHIHRLQTGVPGLDRVLDFQAEPGEGGLPEYSFNMIVGGPGAGKTTLAHQIIFANASPERPALYFTVLGEPPLKMLRYQSTYSYFDPAMVGESIRFVNLSQEVLASDLDTVLESIVRIVEERNPAFVVVDSFRTVMRAATSRQLGELELQGLVQRLALHLSSWQATTFLVGEYSAEELRDNPVYTVADGLLLLFQSVDQNSVVRKLQVLKMRGQETMPGLHTFRITDDGLHVYPRIPRRFQRIKRATQPLRISSGVPGLDAMMGGGIPVGDAVLVGGPSGAGKTVLATQFIAEGVRDGEPGVIAVFEEHPQEYLRRAKDLGFDLEEMVRQGQLKVIYLHPLDLSVDEALQEIQDAVEQVKAQRVVIDSLSGFELTLAPTFRADYRESLYRLVGALTGAGITTLMTVETAENFSNMHFSTHQVSFLADDIIFQRYIEITGELRKMITVIKMRSSAHSKDLTEYRITGHGIEIGRTLHEYRDIITGTPEMRTSALELVYPALIIQEMTVLQTLIALKEATIPALAQATGLTPSVLNAALDRLMALNYVVRIVPEGGQPTFRPVVRAPLS